MAADDGVRVADFQKQIHELFGAKDAARGLDATFLWFAAEVGELAEALRGGSPAERAGEFADVLAWLATLANLAGVDLTSAVRDKYGQGCPRCGRVPCCCSAAGKP